MEPHRKCGRKARMKKIVFGLGLLAITSGALSAGTFVTDAGALVNRGLAASPRAKEEFPALLRHAESSRKSHETESWTAFSPASPRVREQFPQMDRSFRAGGEQWVANGVTARGLSANPRALEENPALARSGQRASEFQVAPLK